MRIALINESFPPLIDGVSGAVVNYAYNMGAKGNEPFVVTPRVPRAKDVYPFPVIRYPSVPGGKRISYPIGNFLSIRTIKKIKRLDPDIIHVHSPFSAFLLARIVRRKTKAPIITTYHTKFDIEFKDRLRVELIRKIATKIVLWCFNSSDETWVVNHGSGKNLESLGYKGDYRVMPNGVDLPKARVSPEQIDALNKKYGVAPDETVFLFLGRMKWYKNIRLILDSLKILKDQDLPFRAIFVGGGEDLEEIKAYSAELNLRDRMIFTGSISDRTAIPVFYSRADLFLFPSTFDNDPLCVKEAAASSCPSLLIEGSCAAEDITDGVNGFLAKENADSCAETILRAISDRELLVKVGKNAAETVYIPWETAVNAALDRYAEVLEKYDYSSAQKKRRAQTRLKHLTKIKLSGFRN